MPYLLTPRHDKERKQSCNAHQTIAHEKVRDKNFYNFLENFSKWLIEFCVISISIA